MAESRTMVRIIVPTRNTRTKDCTSHEYGHRAKTIQDGGAVMALYGSKAVAAGVSAAVSSVLAFLTMPFKGVEASALKVGK